MTESTTHLRCPEDIVNCPECGGRTDFEELKAQDSVIGLDAEGHAIHSEPQLHTCLNCDYRFISEVDEDCIEESE